MNIRVKNRGVVEVTRPKPLRRMFRRFAHREGLGQAFVRATISWRKQKKKHFSFFYDSRALDLSSHTHSS